MLSSAMKINNNMSKVFLQSAFAGLLIGLGGFAYLSNPVTGVFLFAFGLTCVVLYKLPLYTGTVGFVDFKCSDDWKFLIVVLIGNIFGTLISSIIACCGPDCIIPAATEIIHQRTSMGFIRCFILAIGCGVVMSAAVEAARAGKTIANWLPLLFGIPVFISCGMLHSIADMFYFCVSSISSFSTLCDYSLCWIFAVLGNGIGCNLYRIFFANKITG